MLFPAAVSASMMGAYIVCVFGELFWGKSGSANSHTRMSFASIYPFIIDVPCSGPALLRSPAPAPQQQLQPPSSILQQPDFVEVGMRV